MALDTDYSQLRKKRGIMRDRIREIIDCHRAVADAMSSDTALIDGIERAVVVLTDAIASGGTVFSFGNGGSAADAQHFTAELVGRFSMDRRGLPAVSLTTDASVMTSLCNDFGYEDLFARQIEALGKKGDAVLAISTSGNSPNIIRGINAAREKGMEVVGLGGKDGGGMAKLCTVALIIPSDDTPRIQEGHVLVYHTLCELIERRVAGA